MIIKKLVASFILILAAVSANASTNKFHCEQLTTPRVFGGQFKTTQFLSVAMDDSSGNMLAGGYTQDETIFVYNIDETFNQTAVPILALYPMNDFSQAKLYQIYIWPTGMEIGLQGRVAAVSISNTA